MADSTQVRSGLNIFLQRKTAGRVQNALFETMPTLEFFFALNSRSTKSTGAFGLGRPKSGTMISALNGVAQARRERIFAERQYEPIVQVTKPDKSDVKTIVDHDNDPTVPAWDSTNRTLERFKKPRFKFCAKSMPYKIAHSDLRTAKAGSGSPEAQAASVVNVYDAEVKTREAVLCELLNDMLWGVNSQAGSPSDEDDTVWDSIHSIPNALKTDNTYGGVDRTVAANSYWQGNYETTAHTESFYDLIDYCNYDLGMIKKGRGVQILAVGGTLMKKAKAEARADSYTLMTSGIPEYPEFGFKQEIVRIYIGKRPVYIYYEPALDANPTHVAALDPGSWTVAIHPDSNFRIEGPHNQRKVEGGDRADTGTIDVELMIACEDPAGNAYFTNVS